MTTPREHAIQLHNHYLIIQKTDPQMAYRTIASAVEADPTFSNGWFLLGNVLAENNSHDAAIACFHEALRCPEGEEKGDLNPQLRLAITVNLGHRLMHAGDLAAAEEVTDAAIRMYHRGTVDKEECRISAAFAHTNRSLIYAHRGLDGSAVVEARRGYEMHKEPMTEMGLAFALLFNKQYAEGLRHFEARFDYRLHQYKKYPYPKWQWACEVD